MKKVANSVFEQLKNNYYSISLVQANRVLGFEGAPARHPPGGGALPYKPIRDVPFFRVSFFSTNSSERGMKIDEKFRNGLWLFVQEQNAIVFNKNRLLFSIVVFLLFCNLKIPKQGIKMQIFFLNGLWRLLKMGTSPSSYIQVPPLPGRHHNHFSHNGKI